MTKNRTFGIVGRLLSILAIVTLGGVILHALARLIWLLLPTYPFTNKSFVTYTIDFNYVAITHGYSLGLMVVVVAVYSIRKDLQEEILWIWRRLSNYVVYGHRRK